MNLKNSKQSYLETRFHQFLYSIIHIRTQNLTLVSLGFIFGITAFSNLGLFIILGIIVLMLPLRIFIKIICIIVFTLSFFSFVNLQSYIFDSGRDSFDVDNFAVLEEPPSSNKYSTPLTINLENIKGKVLVLDNFDDSYLQQDILLVRGRIENIQNSNLDDGYKNFLISKGILWNARALDIELVSRGENLLSSIAIIREKILEKINFELSSPEDSLAAGITIGAKTSIPEEVKEDLRATGTSHIVSVSGYNVALIFSLILSLAGFINRKKLLFISVIFLLLYGAIVGFYNLPALRAVIMILIMIILSLNGKRYEAFSALIISSAFILVLWPLYLINASFLLSVTATFGIFIVSPVIINFLKGKNLNKFFAEIIGSTFAATLTTMPIIIIFFNEVSILSIPSNLLVLPFIPAITFFALFAIVFSFLIPIVGSIMFYITGKLLELVTSILSIIGRIEGSVINRFDLNILLFLTMFAAVILMDYSNYRKHLK